MHKIVRELAKAEGYGERAQFQVLAPEGYTIAEKYTAEECWKFIARQKIKHARIFQLYYKRGYPGLWVEVGSIIPGEK